MHRLVIVVTAAATLIGTACKNQEEGASASGQQAGTAAKPGTGTATPSPPLAAVAAAVEQKELNATRGGQALGPLYAVARLDPNHGKTYAITIAREPVTCATLDTMAAKAAEEAFEVRVSEALAPDGTITWAFAQLGSNLGATVPANLEKMLAFEVTGDRVSGTLPEGVDHQELVVGGRFAASLCAPIAARPERDTKDQFKDAAPIPVKGGPAELAVAGKRFEIKGATAIPAPSGNGYQVRLSTEPHGCSLFARADIVVSLGLGGATPTISLGGHWLSGNHYVDVGEGLKVVAKRTGDTVEVTLAGAMDYNVDGRPGAQPYKVELTGTLTAPMCEFAP